MNMAPVKREARTFIRKIAGIYGGQVNDRSEHSPSKVHVVARIGICLVRDEADASGSRRLNRPAMKATCHPRQYRAQAVLQRHPEPKSEARADEFARSCFAVHECDDSATRMKDRLR
jgi:hypothetical protein